ncbi:paralemmin 2 [Turdus rufiventris]|nr:paralemmin 2 [Turdus rufiventris]
MTSSPKSLLMFGIALIQVQVFALPLFELHKILMGPRLWFVQGQGYLPRHQAPSSLALDMSQFPQDPVIHVIQSHRHVAIQLHQVIPYTFFTCNGRVFTFLTPIQRIGYFRELGSLTPAKAEAKDLIWHLSLCYISHHHFSLLVCREIQGALCTMEINVEKDKQTGETKIVSASPVGPDEAHQRGFKVYDDGSKVVYEVHSGGTVVENGVHKLSSKDVDELMQKAGQSSVKGGYETMTVSDKNVVADGNLSHMKEQMLFKEAKLEMVHKSSKGRAVNPQPQDKPCGGETPEASADQPVTMIFMGYQNIDDEEETKKVLGYDETIKAELVLIDEDDEKSLREKTVTDVSTMDGNAAELVSGRPLSDTTEPSSPEGKEESLPLEAAPDSLDIFDIKGALSLPIHLASLMCCPKSAGGLAMLLRHPSGPCSCEGSEAKEGAGDDQAQSAKLGMAKYLRGLPCGGIIDEADLKEEFVE